MKIYTKRGDQGQTDLFGGKRVAKDDRRVEAYGEVDELNAALGLCAAELGPGEIAELLHEIQTRLFDIGAHLATPDPHHRAKARLGPVSAVQVAALEAAIDRYEAQLAPLERFILPGGTRAAAALHLARTVCRRAERRVVHLREKEPLDPEPLRYLNRLSDLLFVLAREANRRAGVADVEWQGVQRRTPDPG